MPPLKLMERDSEKTASKQSYSSQDELVMKHAIKQTDVERVPEAKTEDVHTVEDKIIDDLSTLCLDERVEEKEREENDRKILSSGRQETERHSSNNLPPNQSPTDDSVGDVHSVDTEHAQCGHEETGPSQSEPVQTGLADCSSAACLEATSQPHIDDDASKDQMKPVQTGSSGRAKEFPEVKMKDDKQDANAIETNKKRKKKKKQVKSSTAENPMLVILKHIEQCLMEWRTEETLKHLYKRDKESDLKETLKSDGSGSDIHHSDTDQSKRPHFQILKDFEKEIGSRLDEEEAAVSPASKPLPEFKKLTEEQEQYALKIREFYAGSETPASTKPKADASGDVKEVG